MPEPRLSLARLNGVEDSVSRALCEMRACERYNSPDEVEDEGVDDLVWKSVLLVEKDADEERVRA